MMKKPMGFGDLALKQLVFSALFGFLLILPWKGIANSQRLSKEALEKQYYSSSFRAAPKDGFPVLYNPPMGTAKDGDRILQPNEWVIGIAVNREARAYPVDVMGFHELLNDVVAGTPITVCW